MSSFILLGKVGDDAGVSAFGGVWRTDGSLAWCVRVAVYVCIMYVFVRVYLCMGVCMHVRVLRCS